MFSRKKRRRLFFRYLFRLLLYRSFTVNDGGKSYTLTKCDSASSGEIKVPAFYNEKPVTAIGANAFLGCTEITSVTVPEGVEEIGDKAFYNCRNLVTLKLPETVAAIGREAFSLCKKLSDITLPSGKCEIKQGAFTGCDVLKKGEITPRHNRFNRDVLRLRQP